MRAPQYGSKRAGRKVTAPAAADALQALAKPFAVAAAPKVRVDAPMYAKRPRAAAGELNTTWGYKAAYNLRGAVPLGRAVAALPGKRIKYLEPKAVRYSDGQTGAPVTLKLHHKSQRHKDGVRVDQHKMRIAEPPKDKVKTLIVVNEGDTQTVRRFTRFGPQALVWYENPTVSKPYSVVKSSQTDNLRGTP